ncbi:MAG: hypothetical protein AVDCRST_MAG93-831, partial [uncultured Chloroflexia bacterium]
SEIIAALRSPFPWETLEVRPGAVRKDGSGALALAYADPRVYQARLDTVVGPANWSVDFAPWGENKLICRLTIFGIVKSSTGEADSRDPNAGTVAEAQAFKRACVAFGVGRFLYDLPQVWARGSGDSKNFKFDNPVRIVAEMRHKYELAHPKPTLVLPTRDPEPIPHTDPARPARPIPLRSTRSAPAHKQAAARTALEAAERRTGLARS